MRARLPGAGRVTASAQPPLVIAFRNRNPEADERFGLVRAIQKRGIETYCVLVRGRPRIAGPEALPDRFDQFAPIGFPALIAKLRGLARGRRVIYLDTTGLTFPGTMLAMRAILPRGIWVFDMNDDLLYAHTGRKRLEMRVRQHLLTSASRVVVLAGVALQELFPKAHHLGNASDIDFIERSELDPRAILILTSIDGRFDFDLVQSVSARLPGHVFHLYGHVNYGAPEAPVVKEKLDRLLAETTNIVYHGAYKNTEVREILARFGILFAPYRCDSHLVRYIDPIRYYAGLNSGIEIVTTPVPASAALAARLHIAATPEAVIDVLQALDTTPEATRRNGLARPVAVNWDAKAGKLLEIVDRVVAR